MYFLHLKLQREDSSEESEPEAPTVKRRTLELCTSGVTQSASLQLIIAKYDTMLSEVDMDTLLGIIHAINKVISNKSTIQSQVNAKLLSLTLKLFTCLGKLCKDERADVKRLPEGY